MEQHSYDGTTSPLRMWISTKPTTQSITGGQYTMSTTKKGRLIRPKNRERFCDIWSIGGELGRLAVNYHMGYTLQVRYILRTIVNLHGTYWYNHSVSVYNLYILLQINTYCKIGILSTGVY